MGTGLNAGFQGRTKIRHTWYVAVVKKVLVSGSEMGQMQHFKEVVMVVVGRA